MAEIVNCPQCERKLRVPEELLGKKVKCPTCQSTFTASAAGSEPAGVAAPPPPREEPAPRPRSPEEDFQFEDRPSRRPPPRRDEEDDDRDDRPSRRRRDEDDDGLIRRRVAPHRGGLILTFGILSLALGFFICGLFLPGFGIPAWIMGNKDIREMRAGRMDREGESMTNIGRILGMVACGLSVLGIVCGVGFLVIRGIAGATHK
jgi:predicted Zn finger-like uncharacterized protein